MKAISFILIELFIISIMLLSIHPLLLIINRYYTGHSEYSKLSNVSDREFVVEYFNNLTVISSDWNISVELISGGIKNKSINNTSMIRCES